MGFKDIIQNIGSKQKARKEMIRQLDEQMRIEKLVNDRTLSANERELERFDSEEREEQIKEALDVMRKKRDQDIKFGHNPLNTKNIMKSEWEVLKEPNQFSKKSNMFANRQNIHKSNKKLLSNGNVLHNQGSILQNQTGGFRI